MKERKDITSLFQDNQHKLEERPSERTWQRLEQKLEEQRGRRRLPFYRSFMLAAAAVGLILFVSVFALFNLQKEQNAEAVAVAGTPLQWEELDVDQMTKEELRQLVVFRRKNRLRLNQPIPEGAPGKKILVKANIAEEWRTNRSPNANLAQANTSKPLEQTPNTYSTESSAPIASVPPIGQADATTDAMPSATTSDVAIAMEEEAPAKTQEVEPIAESEIEADDVAGIALDEVSVTAPMAKDEAAILEEDQYSKRKESRGKMAANDAFSAEEKSKKVKTDITSFHWLIGQWQKDVGSARQLENWTTVDPHTIAGKGYMLIGQDTLFVESMTIQEIGNALYYVMSPDQGGPQVRYKFSGFLDQKAVFENNTVAFPQQVILHQQTGSRSFSTILQNSDEQAAAAMNSRQKEYFSNRNAIGVERVERQLNRTNK